MLGINPHKLVPIQLGPTGPRVSNQSIASQVHFCIVDARVWPVAPTSGIGTTAPAVALQVVGNIRVGTSGTNACLQQFAGTALTGTCSSDKRLKKDIKPLGRVLDRLSLIEPSTYRWRADEFPERHYGSGLQLGVIAQQVREHMPEMVEEDDDGYLKVHFGDLPIYLLEGLRDLNADSVHLKAEKDAQIAQLKAEKDAQIAQLKAESAQLKAESAQLKNFICSQFPLANICSNGN